MPRLGFYISLQILEEGGGLYYLIQGFIFVLVWTGILFGVSPLAPTWLLITLFLANFKQTIFGDRLIHWWDLTPLSGARLLPSG